MEGNTVESQAFHAFSKIQSLLHDGMDIRDFEADSSFIGNFGQYTRNNLFQQNQDESLTMTTNNVEPKSIDLLKMNINEESFENRLHPDEGKFHEILQSTMQRIADGSVIGCNATDNIAQADIVTNYAFTAQNRYVETAQQSRINESEQTLPDRRSGWKSTVLQRELGEIKAERDLWSLLEILTMSNLMDDIDEDECDMSLNAALTALPVVASVPDFVNAAYTADLRIRKGAVLKEWLEKAALDRVGEAPVPKAFPGSDTMSRILRESTKGNTATQNLLQSLHPDAQLMNDGMLLPMDGADRLDQELLLKSIWQLVRSGQIPKAQQTAADHHVYWLAASLQGVASHYHKPITLGDIGGSNISQYGDEQQENDPTMVVGVTRMGNLRQPVWTRTCWKYASKLAAHPGNWSSQSSKSAGRDTSHNAVKSDSLVGVLELSIYAALSNNTKVLNESPLLSSWHDRVWSCLKATHERDLARVIHRYRCIKSAHSSLYPGCEMSVITTERDLLDWSRSEIGHMSTGSCIQIFNKVPPPASRTTESLLLKLQAAVMEGRSGLLNYIENTMLPVLQEKNRVSIPGLPLLLRVYCHLVIWLRYSPNDSSFTGAETVGTNLSELVSDEVLYLAVESYIDHLIEHKQRTLVAAYAAFLDRARRINKYAELLRSVQVSVSQNLLSQQQHESSGQSVDAAEVLQLAGIFFPQDVMDITRAVVENVQVAVTAPSPAPAPRKVRFAETPSVQRTPVRSQSGMDGDEESPLYNRLSGRQATPGHVTGSRLNDLQSPPATVSQQQLVVRSAQREHGNAMDAPTTDQRDKQQMEALRWLFFDPAHRVEAVKQTNRLITTFLAESDGAKLHLVRALLIHYLPYDSIAVGSAFLAQREAELRDVLADHATRQFARDEEDADALTEMQSTLQLDELCWSASVCKLELWRSLVGAMEDVDTHRNLLVEYSAAKSRLVGSRQVVLSSLGRYRAKVERHATIATDSLMRTIVCDTYTPDIENPVEGYRGIWLRSDEACVSSVIRLGESIVSLTTQSSGQNEGDHNTKAVIEQTLREALEMASTIFPHDLQHSNPQVLRLIELLQHIPHSVAQCTLNSSDVTLKISTAATQIRLCLQDYSESLSVREMVLNTLLSTYHRICDETAHVLENLGHAADACIWHSKGIRVADLVASEDDSLRLYDILNRRDLERLLNGINESAMQLLRLEPNFEIV